MKKFLAMTVMAVGLSLGLTGCAHNVTAPPPPLVNQVNDFDGQTYRSLIGLSSSLDSLKASIKADPQNLGSLQPSVDAAGDKYNLAMAAWKTYHATATAANQLAAQQALANAQTSIDALKTQVTAK